MNNVLELNKGNEILIESSKDKAQYRQERI